MSDIAGGTTMRWPRWQMHPNAVVAPFGRARWYPVLHLVWLAWMLAAPWSFDADARPRVLALTVTSVLVFLPLYFAAWYGEARRIAWNTAAIAVLGLVMIPVNTSWSYVIYAAVLIPYCTSPRRAIAWLVGLMALFSAIALSVGFSTMVTLAAVLMCVILASISLIDRVNHRHDAALRLSHDEVRRLAATAERERIGRDLHDLLGHTLSLIAVKSELARRLHERGGDSDREGARREIEDIERISREALAQVRSAVTGFRAAGIAAELASARLLLESSGITLTYRGENLPLPSDVESAFALCLREAVTNVHRHARATKVEITLGRDGRHASLVIADDGRGSTAVRGNGLQGIDERLRELGGTSTFASSPGNGSRLVLRVPDRAVPPRDASHGDDPARFPRSALPDPLGQSR